MNSRQVVPFAFALLILGCGDDVSQNVIITLPAGTVLPTAAPSTPAPTPPGGAAPCVVPALRVAPFGYDCIASVPVPSNTSGRLPIGCIAVLTATPKYGDGRDVPPELHGPNISWSVISGQNVVALIDFPNEPFNKLVKPLSDTTADPTDVSSGFFTIQATACGTTGTFTAQVG